MRSTNMRNKTMSRLVLAALIATTVATAADDAADTQKSRPRIRFGGLIAGVGYSSGPWWYPRYGYGYGYGLYDPIFYSPYIHPGFYNGFFQQPNMGQVKLGTEAKDASVYVDGAYAGPAHKL